MLQPKRVKYRKAQRGRMKGTAHRGATLAFGDFGLKALEPCSASTALAAGLSSSLAASSVLSIFMQADTTVLY